MTLRRNETADSRELPIGVRKGIAARIDSTRPYLLLPSATCDAIRESLGLIWDPASKHYLIDDETHARLTEENPKLYLRVAPLSKKKETDFAQIVLTYRTMALELGYPHLAYGNRSTYFPIMPTDDPDQFVLGRAFLQGAYLIVNYERRSFAVNVVNFEKTEKGVSVVPILPSKDILPKYLVAEKRDLPKSSKMAIGPILGIVIGIAVLIGIFTALFFYIRRKRTKRKLADELEQNKLDASLNSQSPADRGVGAGLADINADAVAAKTERLHEIDGTAVEIVELEDKPITELPDTPYIKNEIYETDGTPVTEYTVYEKGQPIRVQVLRNGNDITPPAQNPRPPSPVRDLPPASPIPQTPLRFYGKVPTSFRSADDTIVEERQPELPLTQLIPPTIVEPSSLSSKHTLSMEPSGGFSDGPRIGSNVGREDEKS
jgi:hypothetical protein